MLGIVIFVSPLWLNILRGKVCNPAPIVAEVSSTMDWKDSRPTVVTESGSDTLVKLVEAKARWPMAVIPLPNAMDAVSARDHVLEVVSACAITATHLSREVR